MPLTPILQQRAPNDLVRYPLLAERIFQYFAATGQWNNLLRLFERYVRSGESLYESVETVFFEVLLRCNIPATAASPFRKFAYRWFTKVIEGSGRPHSRGVAVLCLYWLGDARSVRSIERVLREEGRQLPQNVVRSLIATLAAFKPDRVEEIVGYCAELGGGGVSNFGTLIRHLASDSKTKAYVPDVSFRKPRAFSKEIIEARTWLRLEVLAVAVSTYVKNYLKHQRQTLQKRALGSCEMRAFRRWVMHIDSDFRN